MFGTFWLLGLLKCSVVYIDSNSIIEVILSQYFFSLYYSGLFEDQGIVYNGWSSGGGEWGGSNILRNLLTSLR